jgi:hypothetical protein
MPFDVVAFFGRKQERVRLLRKSEVIPKELEAGFDILGQIDPDWCWILEQDGAIKGVLIASPAHGAAMIWRLSVAQGCSQMSVGKLLRAFLRDCRKRSIRGFLTVLSSDREQEQRLATIIEHAGGKKIMGGLELYASPIPRENI